MNQDLHYNQAYIFFEDAKYSRALEEMARSETIDDESFKKFAAQCNAMIAQQYLITIKQLISDGDYEEAQRLKREYQDNYQPSELINAIAVPQTAPQPTSTYKAPSQTSPYYTSGNDDSDDSESSYKMWFISAGITGLVLILVTIMCSSSHSDSSYDYNSAPSDSVSAYENYYQESYESETAVEEVDYSTTSYNSYESESSNNNDYSSGSYNDNSADVWE